MPAHRQLESNLLPLLLLSATSLVSAQTASVLPKGETHPVPSGGDAADDTAFWVHPTQPLLSFVIGTDKESGLAVYELTGVQRQFVPGGKLNNVDLRYGFHLGSTVTAIVTSGERDQNVLAIYAVQESTRTLAYVAARAIPLGMDVYGCCMYRSSVTGDYYCFLTSEDGLVQQWRLFENGTGLVDAALVRSFDVGDQSEGCVADDESGWFFVAEEDAGIWRYGAEPGAGSTRVLVDSTAVGGNLTRDVEGLSIYYAANGAGYLIASSQGNSRYVVYERTPPHAHRLSFTTGDNLGSGIDAATGTDGLDVCNLRLGSQWPGGTLMVQDDANPGANQNFKLIDWRDVAAAATPPLVVDTTYDAFGARAVRASRTYRNGTGQNPFVLTSATAPGLATPFAADLDCPGHAQGPAVIDLSARPASGIIAPAGEVLVDRTSTRLVRLARLHGGASVRFDLPVPPDVSLCGFEAFAQGICYGAPGTRLSNAMDMVLGW